MDRRGYQSVTVSRSRTPPTLRLHTSHDKQYYVCSEHCCATNNTIRRKHQEMEWDSPLPLPSQLWGPGKLCQFIWDIALSGRLLTLASKNSCLEWWR